MGASVRRARIRTVTASLLCTAASFLALSTPVGANPNSVNPIPVLNGTNGLPALHGRTQAVAQATGLLSPNRTQDYNVLGTDLGIMWDNGNGQILTAFGDTAGVGIPNLLVGSLWSWRSNILVRSSDGNLADGMTFDSAPRDVLGQAKELVPSPKIPSVEISRIPTAGIAVDGVQYMSFMSVKDWGDPGRWATNYSQLAFSADNGENWTEAPETRRPATGGNGNFQMGAFVKDGGYVYQYGTPPGRGGLVFLARVPEKRIRDLDAYEYWNGDKWIPKYADAAAPIVFGGVGELSVQYNSLLGQYLMLTTDGRNSVVMRRSPSPTGPWSAPEILVDGSELPTMYGAYMHPWSSGPDLYFLTTVHTNYNVLLMHTTLQR
ncbi:DUF4185 domain-containing protein [Rhodococcus sp. ABRD24]|uniref:DUF4185 domain-containing protein n=1 Tax=Rhodococcus sp. ABRD24 TaxID=2507582 RepID=UPI00103F8935|nr:DUF4185 domain-containing protein [Rhodococcus sp. ABRD24]QBJ96029.1 DUF4185 domain-containing protein [Rhodococcus sp. ABRD24]